MAQGDGQGGKPGQAVGKAGPAAKASSTPSAAPSGPPAAAASKPTAPSAAAVAAQAPKPAAPSAPAAAAAAATPPPQAPAAGAGAAAAAGGAAAAAEGGQKWIVHPAVPIDARLLAAGVAGAGLLAYNLTSGGEKASEAPVGAELVEVSEGVVEAPAEAQQTQQAEQEGAALADTAPQHVDEGFHTPQQAQQGVQEQAQQQGGPGPEPVTVVIMGVEEQEAPTVVDGSQVGGLPSQPL